MPEYELFNNDWEEVIYPCNKLWTGFDRFYRHKSTNVHTIPGLGDPFILDRLQHEFIPRPADVNVITYPKAGTTWMQELAYLVDTEVDIKTARSVPLEVRFPFAEVNLPPLVVGLDAISKFPPAPAPRYIKWHNAMPLLPQQIFGISKSVYVARNPKDLCVSMYHFARMNRQWGFVGNFEQFFDCFLDGTVPFGPFWFNVLSYWVHRDNPNLLFVKYEDLHEDPLSVIKRVAEFLDRPLNNVQIRMVAENISFDAMKENPMVNHSHWDKLGVRKEGESRFFRSGKVGDWQKHFSAEQDKRMNEWIRESSGKSGLSFDYGQNDSHV